jgi:hypothetical protein
MIMRSWFVSCVVTVGAVGLFILATMQCAALTRATIRGHDRYGTVIQEIVCDAPPGLDRAEFISEVQYLANLPSVLSILEPDLPARMAGAFAGHPWVEAVERVELRAPRSLKVRLAFRKPVLRVVHRGTVYVVDRYGIILPDSANTDGLPVHNGRVGAPGGPAGSAWGDPVVEAAAREAARMTSIR